MSKSNGVMSGVLQHSPFTTVGEALWISARLRFDNTVDNKTVKAFIEEVEGLVELENLRKSLVGTPGKDGLSVEQRKRLTIAVELVANPSIIFMDVSCLTKHPSALLSWTQYVTKSSTRLQV